jgi:esterase/lipase
MGMAGIAAAILAVAGLAVGGAVQAQQAQTLKGHLVDVMCATKHATEADYIAKHDKKCLLMEGCVKSGYSLVTTDGKVLKLDAKGSQQALDLIKRTERTSNWTVAVNGTVSRDTITVASIQLQ